MDSAGNLYGLAGGGVNRGGTIFKIDPDGTETILYSFGTSATDVWAPVGSLIVDSAGNLYGASIGGGANFETTLNGYIDQGGTVFVLD
jgi:uncharacterized repeat protein (TIGR03803 family)